jgi:hypothetical protein
VRASAHRGGCLQPSRATPATTPFSDALRPRPVLYSRTNAGPGAPASRRRPRHPFTGLVELADRLVGRVAYERCSEARQVRGERWSPYINANSVAD